MPEPDEFQDGTNWQQASGPHVIIQVHEADIWPVADNSGSGTKDAIAGGLHPVIAIGGRTAADGRPLNMTGVVVTFTAGLLDLCRGQPGDIRASTCRGAACLR
jgi:hypothetical protein